MWSELASDLAGEFYNTYAYVERWGYRICITEASVYSPDRKLVRYRTIEASIRRRPGMPTLIELCAGNLFSMASESPPDPIHIVNEPQYARWARHAGAISLSDHVRLIEQFVEDLMDAGWILQQASLTPFEVHSPLVLNGRGVQPLPPSKFYQLARYPAKWPDREVGFCVVSQEPATVKWAAEKLNNAFESVFGSATCSLSRVRTSRRLCASMVNLLLLDDKWDLRRMPDLREELRAAEAAGIKFKLAKASSLQQTYPARNIAYDMFIIAGGRPWTPDRIQPEFCSMDAGHDRERGLSRWVKVESDDTQIITQVQYIDTSLAEHIPREIIDSFWPKLPNAIICRDGRLSQEKESLEERASQEGLSVLESKKSPKAILWRQVDDQVKPANFGDSVLDEHDELLLQTMPQNIEDCIHPVRLKVSGGDLHELATAYFHQQAIPGLSLTNMARLPGTLYFADLISKLTDDGWPKAIGRGFRIPGIIP